jgi:ribosomal protein S27E
MGRHTTPGSSLIAGSCSNCNASMLIHDGSTGEVTCQMCSRSFACDRTQSGHEHCAGPMLLSWDPALTAKR